MWVLLLLLTALAWAQPAGAPKPVFPDDTQDPKQAGGAELWKVVCPENVIGRETCECPEFTAFPDGADWRPVRMIRGHFLSPTSDDAVLAMDGCESHGSNFGGTILLTRQSGKWTMLWYKGGVPTTNCHRVKLQSGREILICLGEWGGQGNVWTDLYVEDLTAPTPALMSGKDGTIFEVFDSTLTCGEPGDDESKPVRLRRHYIERVQFQNAANGTFLGLSVFARRGERTMTIAQVKACINEELPGKPHRGLNLSPPTKPYRVDFKFDGKQTIRVGERPGAPK